MNKDECKEIFEEYIGKKLRLVADGNELVCTLQGLKAIFLEVIPLDTAKKKMVRCDTITEFEEYEEAEEVVELVEEPVAEAVAAVAKEPEAEAVAAVEPEVVEELSEESFQQEPQYESFEQYMEQLQPMEVYDGPKLLLEKVEPKVIFEADELLEDYELRLLSSVGKAMELLDKHGKKYTQLKGEAFLELIRRLNNCVALSNELYISEAKESSNAYALAIEKIRQYLLDKLQFEYRELPLETSDADYQTWERLYQVRVTAFNEANPTIVYDTLNLLQEKLETVVEQGHSPLLPVGFQKLLDEVNLEEFCAVVDISNGHYIGSYETFKKNYLDNKAYLSQFSGVTRRKVNFAILKIYCDLVASQVITKNDSRIAEFYSFATSIAKDMAEELLENSPSNIEAVRGWYKNALLLERDDIKVKKLLFRYFSTLFIAPGSLNKFFDNPGIKVSSLVKKVTTPKFNIVCIIDNSLSMLGDKMAAVNASLDKYVNTLYHSDLEAVISIVETGNKKRIVVKQETLGGFLKLNYKVVAEGHGHRLDLALRSAYNLVGNASSVILIFTDVTKEDWQASPETMTQLKAMAGKDVQVITVALGKECDDTYLRGYSWDIQKVYNSSRINSTINSISEKTISKYVLLNHRLYDYEARDIKLATQLSCEDLMGELCDLKLFLAPFKDSFLYETIKASGYEPMVIAWLKKDSDNKQSITEDTLKKFLADRWEKYHDFVKKGISELRFYALAPDLNNQRINKLQTLESSNLAFLASGDLLLWRELVKAMTTVRNNLVHGLGSSFEENVLFLDRTAQGAFSLFKKCLLSTSSYVQSYISRIAYKWYENLEQELVQALYRSKPVIDCQLSKTVGSFSSILHLNLTNAAGRLTAHDIVVILPGAQKLYVETLIGNEKTYSTTLPDKLNNKLKALKRKGVEAILEYKYIEAINSGVIKYRSETKYLWLPMPADKVFFEAIKNPYAAISSGDAVESTDMVYGRDQVINNIVQAINFDQPKTYILWGQKRTGKSTVLLQLQKALEQKQFAEQPVLVAFDGITEIDVDSLKGHAEVMLAFKKFLLRGIEGALKKQEAIKKAFLANDYKLGKLTGADINDRFEEFFTLYKDLEGKKPLILFIDEFTQAYIWIQKAKLEASFIKWWREFLRVNKLVAIIVGQDYMQKFIELDGNGFGTMEKVKINYLTQEDTFKLIKEPILRENSQIAFEEEALEEVYELTAGSAFFTVKLCDLLVNYLNQNNIGLINHEAIFKVKESMLKGNNALTADFFEALYNDEGNVGDMNHKEDSYKLCKLIADNASQVTRGLEEEKLYSLAKDKYELTRQRTEKLIQALTRREVLDKNHNTYKIKVQLFHEWLMVKG